MNVIDGIGLAKDVSVVLKLENIFLFVYKTIWMNLMV